MQLTTKAKDMQIGRPVALLLFKSSAILCGVIGFSWYKQSAGNVITLIDVDYSACVT